MPTVEIVESLVAEGFPVSRIGQVLEFNRSRYYRHQRTDGVIKVQEKTSLTSQEADRYLMEKIKAENRNQLSA